MREEPQSHPRPGGVDWRRETELSPSSHQVNCLSSLLSVTNLYGVLPGTRPGLNNAVSINKATEKC